MTITKEAIEKRKEGLTKDFTSLEERINSGAKALESMKSNLSILSGAIQQCNFFLDSEKKDVKDK
tara:strand:- start:491 stop:685 length:195 start_codon:yes stop_codon:yes gene_type:complete